MARIYVSDVINAPIEKVWALIRDFNGMPGWHPLIRDSQIENGLPSNAVGCVRNFHLSDGGHLREQLLSLSDRDHSCVYCILDSPLPVKGYVAGYRLLPSPQETAASSIGGRNSTYRLPMKPRWLVRCETAYSAKRSSLSPNAS